MLKSSGIHVFTALFATNEEASAFGHPRWEPEPSQDSSEEEYTAWEDRNPIWPMKSELGCSIDNDFVEIIWKSGKEPDWDYLVSRLDLTQVTKIRRQTQMANTLVLIDHMAIGGEPPEFMSTGKLTYHGRHKASS
ncbi:hypothetical protein DSM25558_4211 [Agrobacterium sp. DSM 25558]|uniref:hypothetical protein n=1 Tax=Agrobacterium sp. DSM 25558 TaxID=1907665 RepID=UPI0009726474|nr:hypothetical protein [Agrobacterium sp. DSM 25558]SCX27354.1 hypothetical protein DSM25558_4211 [Agrobacterium sp. DSM 25558]